MKGTLADLPREIQYEIFQYLPVDQLDAVHNLQAATEGNYGSMVPVSRRQHPAVEPNIYRDVLIDKYGPRQQWDLLRSSEQAMPSKGAWRDSLLFMDRLQEYPDLESEVSYNKLLLESARGGATGLIALLVQEASISDEIISLAFLIALVSTVKRNPSQVAGTSGRLEVNPSNIRTASWMLENIDRLGELVFPPDTSFPVRIRLEGEYGDSVNTMAYQYYGVSNNGDSSRQLISVGAGRNFYMLEAHSPILFIREYIYRLMGQDIRNRKGKYDLSILSTPPYADLVNLLHLIAGKGHNPFASLPPRQAYSSRYGDSPILSDKEIARTYLVDYASPVWTFVSDQGTTYYIANKTSYPGRSRDVPNSWIETSYPLMMHLGYVAMPN